MPAADPGADRYRLAGERIDAANAEDPTEVEIEGERGPKELLHGRWMVRTVLELDPDAGELQLLAARAHHLRRWTSPRTDHPEGRAGYLRWRAAARRRHAEEVRDLLGACGYTDAEAATVAAIVRKEGLGTDPAVQVHEDALCLVFLRTQLGEVSARLGEDHMVDVLVRTLPKMSDRGRAAAAGLPLDEAGRELLARAVATWTAGDATPG
ncbi:MAG: DUF4202 domain-containing protein [Microthrixaceae bacterium]